MYRIRLESLDHQSPMARNASWLIIIYLDLLGLTLLAAISTSAFFLESLFAFLWNRICDFNEWDLLSPLDKAKGGILLGPLPEITYFWFRQICDYNLLKKLPLFRQLFRQLPLLRNTWILIKCETEYVISMNGTFSVSWNGLRLFCAVLNLVRLSSSFSVKPSTSKSTVPSLLSKKYQLD